MSLLEVLISMFVLTIGLLGVAALIPVGRFAMVETGKADRSGACAHAALDEIKVRRMLDPYPWPESPNEPQWVFADGNNAVPAAFAAGSFAIDPLGVAEDMPTNLGGAAGPIARITLRSIPNGPALTLAEAERLFMWHDELLFSLPEDMEPPPATESDRPRASVDASGLPDFVPNYSWLVTVTPAAAEADLDVADKTRYSVSVVVCYRRDFTKNASGGHNGEHTATVDFLGGSGWGGGSVQLSNQAPNDPPLRLRENEWIMLCGDVSGRTICKWYRVVSADSGSPTSYLSLVGPDWDTVASPTPTAVMIDQVVSVYTAAVELDSSALWNK